MGCELGCKMGCCHAAKHTSYQQSVRYQANLTSQATAFSTSKFRSSGSPKRRDTSSPQARLEGSRYLLDDAARPIAEADEGQAGGSGNSMRASGGPQYGDAESMQQQTGRGRQQQHQDDGVHAQLLAAVRQGDRETVRVLCADYANVADRIGSGETALQLAAHRGDEVICRVLLSDGGAVSVINAATQQQKLTALHMAASRGHTACCSLLIEYGAEDSLSMTDSKGYTPLHAAVHGGHAAVAALLIDAGATAIGDSKAGDSPLAVAALMRHADVALVLMKKGGVAPSTLRNATDRAWAEQVLRSNGAPPPPIRASVQSPAVATPPPLLPSDSPSPTTRVTATSSRATNGAGQVSRSSNRFNSSGPAEEANPWTRGSEVPAQQQVPAKSTSSPRETRSDRPRERQPRDRDSFARGSELGEDSQERHPRNERQSRGGHSEPAIWFRIHEDLPEDTDDDQGARSRRRGTGEDDDNEFMYLYRAPEHLRTARGSQLGGSSSLPPISGAGPSGTGGKSGADTKQEDVVLHLYRIAYPGLPEGFLLDREKRFVYYLHPEQQREVLESQQHERATRRRRQVGYGFAPAFVGYWVPDEVPADGEEQEEEEAVQGPRGTVRPIYREWHCVQLEEAKGTASKRCFRHASSAAAWLHARSGVAAEFTGSGLVPPRVSLVIPLVGLLGVHELWELQQLQEDDVQRCFVDTLLLQPLLDALRDTDMLEEEEDAQQTGGAAGGSTGGAAGAGYSTFSASATATQQQQQQQQQTQGGRPGSALAPSMRRTAAANSSRVGRAATAAAAEGPQPTTPPPPPAVQLASLLLEHGLIKLLPLAAELGVTSNVAYWHLLVQAARRWNAHELSRFELARLDLLAAVVSSAQEAAVQRRVASASQLVRVTVGTLVLYEAGCRAAGGPPVDRGDRLMGVVVDDLGPGVQKQFKIRDLMDDEMVWAAAGQIVRVSHAEAMNHLRADLLPPNSWGVPVLPYTAYPGAAVTLAYHFWDGRNGVGIATSGNPEAAATLQDGLDARSARGVVGVILERGDPEGLSWRVRWPDGTVCCHATGANGRFELAHLTLHRAAGAPLMRAHVEAALSVGATQLGQDVGSLAVVRSPLWSRQSTDDEVPGSAGVALLEAGQTVLQVVWGCSTTPRDQLPMYSPDGQGVYQLCHGLVPGHVLTAFTAKEAVPVEDATGRKGNLMGPVALAPGGNGVVWRMQWAEGGGGDLVVIGMGGTEAESGGESALGEAIGPLRVAGTFHIEKQLDRVRVLNEVAVKQVPGCCATSGCCQPKKVNCGIGRAAFWRGPTAHVVGAMSAEQQPLLLGQLVTLNKQLVALQPGVENGPMACFDRIDIPTLLRTRREAINAGRKIEPVPRDDVGVVVRDLGPGIWRGVLVRKYGSTDSWWYDESVLLPACQQDVERQSLRQGVGYAMPRNLQGVPVIDANAAPGMLVQRAYREGAVAQNSDKASTIGVLVGRGSSPSTWTVRWPDGSVRTYRCGLKGQFQLAFAQSNVVAGAPLMHSTVLAAEAKERRLAVTDGLFCMRSACPPGAVRWVNDQETQLGLVSGEARQMASVGLVVTSLGERLFAGGPLELYELSHAVVPGSAVTIFTAKKGLRVELHTEGVDDTDRPGGTAAFKAEAEVPMSPAAALSTPQPRVRSGVLYAPMRFDMPPVRKSAARGSRGGSGDVGASSGGAANSLPRGSGAAAAAAASSSPAKVVWEVLWDEGGSGEFVVGTEPSHTSLKVAGSPGEGQAQDGSPAPAPELYPGEHFVRMLEPVMLVDTGNRHRNRHLARLAASLAASLHSHNALLRQLVAVWWAAAPLMAEGGAVFRPDIELLAVQPDLLTMAVRARLARASAAGPGPWQLLEKDELGAEGSGGVVDRFDRDADMALASAVAELMRAMGGPPADDVAELAVIGAERRDLHLLPAEEGAALLEPGYMMDASGRMVATPDELLPLVQAVNDAASRLRTSLVMGDPILQDDGMLLLDIGCNVEPYIPRAPLAFLHATGRTAVLTPQATTGLPPLPPGMTANQSTEFQGATGRWFEGTGAGGTPSASQQYITPSAPPSNAAAGDVRASSTALYTTRRTSGSDGEVASLNATGRTASGGGTAATAAAAAGPRGGSVMVSVVCQGVRVRGMAGSAVPGKQLGRPVPAGPGALLALGCSPELRKSQLGIQRSIGTLAGTSSAAAPGSLTVSTVALNSTSAPGSRDLVLVGDAPCLWVEAAEPESASSSLPRDLALARCRAGVNSNIFTLWRACCRSLQQGLGSADVSGCMLRLLQVVHAKASAALAGDATRRWARAGATVAADVTRKMELAMEHDTDTFGARVALSVLGDVRLSLACLHFNQAAADAAMAYAERAAVPPEFSGEWGAELLWAKQSELREKQQELEWGSKNWKLEADSQLEKAKAEASRAEDMMKRKAEACTLEGQAKQLRERVQLMIDAEGTTRKVCGQLDDMTAAMPNEEQLRGVTDAVEELQQWARDYEQVKGYKLDPPLRRAIEELRVMVEMMVLAIAKQLSDAMAGKGGAGALELIMAVAELGKETGAKARGVKKGNKRVQDGHDAVLRAVQKALKGAGPGSLLESQLQELRYEVGPVQHAAAELLAAFHVAITSQATFSMQLAKAAARETVVERKTAKIVKRVAEEMAEYIATLPAGRTGMLSLTGSLTGSLEPISVGEVLAAAEREWKVAERKHLAEQLKVLEAEEGVRQVDGRVEVLKGEIREVNHEIAALERSENEDADIQKRALEAAEKAQDQCAEATRSAFPNMAKAVVKVAGDVVTDMLTQLQENGERLTEAEKHRRGAEEDVAKSLKASQDAARAGEDLRAKRDALVGKLKDLVVANQQLAAKKTDIVAIKEDAKTALQVAKRKQEACSLEGLANQLKQRVELMLLAESTSDDIIQQLRRLAGQKRAHASDTASVSSARSALGDEADWEVLRKRVDDLVAWAAEYEKKHGYDLDPNVKTVIGLLKAKVDGIVHAVRRQLAGEHMGGDAGGQGNLHLVMAVAEINMQTANRAREKEVEQGNKRVKDAAQDALNGVGVGAVSVTHGSGAAALLPELQPALEAAEAVAACLRMSITAQAVFTMQLAKAAAKDTIIEQQAMKILEEVAEQMAKHSRPQIEATDPLLKQQLAALPGAPGEGEGISLEAVMAMAQREAKVAKGKAEDAMNALSSARVDASKLREHIVKLNGEVASGLASVQTQEGEVRTKRIAAKDAASRAVLHFVGAEQAAWQARHTLPASELEEVRNRPPPLEPKQASAVARAEAAVKASMEALAVIGHLRAGLPRALRSAEAAERLLAGCSASVAACAARAAAEWARTAALPCEGQLADQEWFDRTLAFLSALSARVAKEKADADAIDEAGKKANKEAEEQLKLLDGLFTLHEDAPHSLDELLVVEDWEQHRSSAAAPAPPRTQTAASANGDAASTASGSHDSPGEDGATPFATRAKALPAEAHRPDFLDPLRSLVTPKSSAAGEDDFASSQAATASSATLSAARNMSMMRSAGRQPSIRAEPSDIVLSGDSNLSMVLRELRAGDDVYLLDLRTGRVYTKALGDDWPELVGSWNGKMIEMLQRSTAAQFFLELEKYISEAGIKFKDIFDHYDKEKKGWLTAQEMRGVVKEFMDAAEGDLKYFEVLIDVNQDGKFTYEEFLSAAQAAKADEAAAVNRTAPELNDVLRRVSDYIKQDQAGFEENLKKVFNRVDINGDDQLEPKELSLMFRTAIPSLTTHEMRLLLSYLRQFDINGDGVISLSELLICMRAVETTALTPIPSVKWDRRPDGPTPPTGTPTKSLPPTSTPTPSKHVAPTILTPEQQLVKVVERIRDERGTKVQSQQLEGPLPWSRLVEAVYELRNNAPALMAAAEKLPQAAPSPMEGPVLDEACAAAAAQLPAALEAYYTLRPQVDPTTNLGAEDEAVGRALAATFGMLDKVAARAAERAEQQAAGGAAGPGTGGAGAAAGARGGAGVEDAAGARGSGSGAGAGSGGEEVFPYAAAKQALQCSQDAGQAADALAALAVAVSATAPKLSPEAAQRLNEVARPARGAANAAKRAQIAVTRALAEAAKADGPPAFASGIHAAVLARLSHEDGAAAKSLMWLVRAAETLQGKVKADMEAAIAAATPPPPKPAPRKGAAPASQAAAGAAGAGAGGGAAAATAAEAEEEPLTPEEEAAEQARLDEAARLARLEQAEKERAVLAFVSRIAAAIGNVASLAGGKLDLSSLSTGSDDLPIAPYIDADVVLHCATRLAEAEDVGAVGGGVHGLQELAWSPAIYMGEDEQTEAQVLVKMCRNLGIVRAANEAIRLAGSHPDVPDIEDGINGNLKSVMDIVLKRSVLLVEQARRLEKESQRSVAAPLKARLREASASAALVAIDDSFIEGVVKKGMHEAAADAIEDGKEDSAEGVVELIMECVKDCLDFSFQKEDGEEGGSEAEVEAGTEDGGAVPKRWLPEALRSWQKKVVLELAGIIETVERQLPGERQTKGVGFHDTLRSTTSEGLDSFAKKFFEGLRTRLLKGVQDAWDDSAAGDRWKSDFASGVAMAIEEALDVKAAEEELRLELSGLLQRACEHTVDEMYPSDVHLPQQMLNLRAYEQVVVASMAVMERMLDAASLVTLSSELERDMLASRSNLSKASAIVRRIVESPAWPADLLAAQQAAEAAKKGAAAVTSSSGANAAVPVKLQVLLSKQRPGQGGSSGGASQQAFSLPVPDGEDDGVSAWQLLVGFAPPPSGQLPVAEHLEEQAREVAEAYEYGRQPKLVHKPWTAAAAWAESAAWQLRPQLKVLSGGGDAGLRQRLTPAQRVLARPAMQRRLAPFQSLLLACNAARAAVAAAAPSRPDDQLLTSHALLGAPDVSRQAAQANLAQFKRWDHDVLNMQSTSDMVLYGLVKSQALALSQVPEVEVPELPTPPPLPAGSYPDAIGNSGASHGGGGGGRGYEPVEMFHLEQSAEEQDQDND